MNNIYSFSKFISLYEADAVTPTEASKRYDTTLGLILTTALSAYREELDLTIPDYGKDPVKADVASVKSSPILDKPGALKAIMAKVQKAAEGNTAAGAKEAVAGFVAVGFKAADALTSLIDQYKDQPEELEHINTSINFGLDSWLKNNHLTESISGSDLDYSGELEHTDLNEGDVLFQGKKGAITEVTDDAARLISKLLGLAEIPGMSSTVSPLTAKASQIQAGLISLKDKKNREINRSDIENARKTIKDLTKQADEMVDKMTDQDKANEKASAILTAALGLLETAKTLKEAYLQAKEKAKAEKIKVTLSVPTIDYDPDETKNVNPEVKKFQELVVDKFKKNKQISSLPQYTKMGTDGKFGKNTRDIIRILKNGFELPETSGDITKQLVDEIQIQADTIGESINTRVYTFSDFVSISEAAFNVTAAVEYSKTLPTYTSTPAASSGSSGSKSSGGSSSSMVFKEGSKGPEVAAIQNAVKALVNGTDEKKNQIFGPRTKEAVMAWQKSNGLKDDGIVGPGTIKKMAEIKNLGNWTASMISKLANVEVKAFVKPKETVSDSDIQVDVDTLVDDLDGFVDSDNLNSILSIIKKYVEKNALADDDKTVVEAIPRLMLLYKRDEDGDTLYGDVESVGLKTLPSSAHKTKKNILNLLKPDLNKPNGDI